MNIVEILKNLFKRLKDTISIAQKRQKDIVGKHQRALVFKENDWVLLKFP